LTKKEVLWSFLSPKEQPFCASAAVTEKLVIAASRDRSVYALERDKGKELWSFATKGRVDSSPVIAGERVYFGSTDGFLYVLTMDKGTEVQKLQLGRGILAGPAVAHGCLVIGTTDGWLYCLAKEGK
jgi:outer membrane protein assembly factor BamB